MGILDIFRKRKDDFGGEPFPDHVGDQYGQPGDMGFGQQPSMPMEPMGMPGLQDQQQPFSGFPDQKQAYSPEQFGYERITSQNAPFYKNTPPQPGQDVSSINIGKDLELISAKLDAIKAELDSVNQRLRRIERLAEDPNSPPRRDAWQY